MQWLSESPIYIFPSGLMAIEILKDYFSTKPATAFGRSNMVLGAGMN
jgi:hypothetical protein